MMVPMAVVMAVMPVTMPMGVPVVLVRVVVVLMIVVVPVLFSHRHIVDNPRALSRCPGDKTAGSLRVNGWIRKTQSHRYPSTLHSPHSYREAGGFFLAGTNHSRPAVPPFPSDDPIIVSHEPSVLMGISLVNRFFHAPGRQNGHLALPNRRRLLIKSWTNFLEHSGMNFSIESLDIDPKAHSTLPFPGSRAHFGHEQTAYRVCGRYGMGQAAGPLKLPCLPLSGPGTRAKQPAFGGLVLRKLGAPGLEQRRFSGNPCQLIRFGIPLWVESNAANAKFELLTEGPSHAFGPDFKRLTVTQQLGTRRPLTGFELCIERRSHLSIRP
jgi:hypothetical protein